MWVLSPPHKSMRFLFSISPTFGHFHAVVPLALALKESGHELAFATGKGFGSVIRRAGFRHFPCGLDFDGSRDIFTALPEWEAIKSNAPSDVAFQQLHGFVLGLAPRMARDLLDLAGAWKPDVIVRDPLEYGGYIAAEIYKIPHATPIWATYIPAQDLVPAAFSELRRSFGLADDPGLINPDRFLVLDFLPPSWTFPDLPCPPVAHRFCAPPCDMSSDSRLPNWVEALSDRPTVYATLGTSFNQAPHLIKSVLRAFSDGSVNLVMTVGRSMDPHQFGKQPEHIHIEQYIPQSLILPYCDALIFHGGFNPLHPALWHALPMVVIPAGAGDQWPTARRCAEIGIGVLVAGEPPEPEGIRTAVNTVLGQPGYRLRLQVLQQELRQLPPLVEAVQRLELLAETREPQVNDGLI